MLCVRKVCLFVWFMIKILEIEITLYWVSLCLIGNDISCAFSYRCQCCSAFLQVGLGTLGLEEGTLGRASLGRAAKGPKSVYPLLHKGHTSIICRPMYHCCYINVQWYIIILLLFYRLSIENEDMIDYWNKNFQWGFVYFCSTLYFCSILTIRFKTLFRQLHSKEVYFWSGCL